MHAFLIFKFSTMQYVRTGRHCKNRAGGSRYEGGGGAGGSKFHCCGHTVDMQLATIPVHSDESKQHGRQKVS